ncbi:MAG: YXWGXW repeat-containing protein [Gemmatimonadales bacterium]|nr:YXWGXW repeat-containing protein [Gemmatimonadales bacterium]
MTFRSMRHLLVALPLLCAGAAACGGHAPPPGAVFVVDAPPRARVEVRGARPEAGWVWIPGHYRWDGTSYFWDRGHWDQVPRGMKKWQPGRWYHGRQGWFWVEGHWR